MLNIALLGFGNIGSGTAEVLTENQKLIEKRLGTVINIKYILDLRDFPGSPFEKLIVHDFDVILNDPDICIIAEMMGGSHPAYEFSKAALSAGKSVVTSNKECVAKFGDELMKLAAENGCRYLFEASVGGGIPIVRPMMVDLAPVNIKSVSGILNGTTNYILTKMLKNGSAFSDVLSDAQAKGYAEKDPTDDVEGIDAARKIVLLAALASGIIVDADKIMHQGITSVTAYDMSVADALGYSIKLIAYYKMTDDKKLLCMVSPRYVRSDNPLYTVNDVFNGILVDTDMLGEVMFYGKGAGKLPTAGAVVADILDIAAGSSEIKPREWRRAKDSDLADFDKYSCRRVFTYKGGENDIPVLEKHFGKSEKFYVNDGKISFITAEMSEWDADVAVRSCPLALINKFRLL